MTRKTLKWPFYGICSFLTVLPCAATNNVWHRCRASKALSNELRTSQESAVLLKLGFKNPNFLGFFQDLKTFKNEFD